ncbi:MAG TPA: response regulator [Gammaproteobacteria bacterium]|nr:response regulator [Gammaproteobacteria bacterium]
MAVLIVDDSRAMRSLLGHILKSAGFTVVEASDGQEALDCLQHGQGINLALVDWNMPGMDGYTFIHAVRAVHAYREVRLMMVTAEAEIEQVSRALAAGADEYIMKPFTRDAVLEKLKLLGILPH